MRARRRSWFQSLIGMLKTVPFLVFREVFLKFQSLIGMLKTFNIPIAVLAITCFNPS